MRIAPLLAAAFCLSAPAVVAAQAPAQSDEEVIVFEATAPPPPPRPTAPRIDVTSMSERVANTVVNADVVVAAADVKLGPLSSGDETIDRMILDASTRHGVDPRLVAAVMHQESRFDRFATSRAGACGYMQLMPGTAKRFGVTDIYDPAQNIEAGTRYLRFLLDLFKNDIGLALAGYNAGEYRVIRSGYRVPDIRETRNYVRIITDRYFKNAQAAGPGRPGVKIGNRYKITLSPVTGGPAMSDQERERIARAAFETSDDRAGGSLTTP